MVGFQVANNLGPGLKMQMKSLYAKRCIKECNLLNKLMNKSIFSIIGYGSYQGILRSWHNQNNS